jgi:hypothetical protein
MDVDSLRQIRRALSAAVAICAIGLVMVKLQAPATQGLQLSGVFASLALAVSLLGLVLVWRKELAANEAAFAERERAQLVMLRLQVELAKKKKATNDADAPERPGSAQKRDSTGA